MTEALLLALLIPTDANLHLVGRYSSAEVCNADLPRHEAQLRQSYPAAMLRCMKVTAAPISSPRPKPRGE